MKNQKLSLRVAGLDNNSSEIDNTINPFNFRDLNVLADSYCPISELPEPGSEEEDVLFKHLYSKLKPIWQALSSETPFSETVVVVPSMTLDAEEMLKINGIEYYEERLLFLLIQLCNPNTEVVYVTSQPLRQSIVDYYLQLLPGIPYSHARRRLHM